MESNAMTSYKDTTPAARLDKQTLNKMVWRPVSYTHLDAADEL